MIIYDYLNENGKIIEVLTANGIIASTTTGQQAIYKDVLSEQSTGSTANESYWSVAERLNISIDTVINATATMQKEIQL